MINIYVTNEFVMEYGDFKIPDGYTQYRIPGTTLVILYPDTHRMIEIDQSAEAVRNAESRIQELHNRLEEYTEKFEEHLLYHERIKNILFNHKLR